jgi:hypothetical protein
MNLNSLQLLGLIMVIFAFGANIFLPGSVVYYSTTQPTVQFAGVGSTNPNSPALGPCGQQTFASALINEISQTEILNASFQISQWSGSVWTILTTTPMTYALTLPNGAGMIYRGPYTLGSTPGILYAISYSLVTTDVGSFSGIGYVQSANLQGYFSINGNIATSNSFIRVSSPTLSLNFTVNSTVTAFAQSGSIVAYINVLDSSGNLIQKVTLSPNMHDYSDNNLTASFTLPNQGSYTLNGYVTYGGSTTEQMSIVGLFGTSGSVSEMSLSDYYWIVGLFGVIFIVLGARQKKKSSS